MHLRHSASGLLEACDRACASVIFARAERAKAILRYVVEKAEAGQTSDIKEYAIALEVFGRASYDPKADSLVRVEASKLRSLLAKFYEGEGRNETVRLEIPKGSYIPRLVPNECATAPALAGGAVSAPAMPMDRAADLVGSENPPGAPDIPPGPGVPAHARQLPVGLAFVALATLLLMAVAGLLALSTRPTAPLIRSGVQASVAVLPFADVSSTGGQQYFADGLTQELISQLAALGTFRVASRTSVARYRQRTDNVQTIGQELDVHALLEGTVQVEGLRVRITASLVDTRDGSPLWTRTYDRQLADVFDLQRDVAADVIRSFDLTHATARRGMVRQRTSDLRAYQYYLRATYLLSGGPDDLREAVEYFHAATVADPGYALAWAALSQALTTRAHWGFASAAEVEGLATVAAERAFALDPVLSEAQQAMGEVHALVRRDPARAEPFYRRAIELDPMNSDARDDYAHLVLLPLHRTVEAVEQLQHAVALDPRENSLRNALASALLYAGRLDEAAAQAAESLRFAPDAPGSRVAAGRVAFARGDVAGAVDHFEQAAANIRTSWVLGYLGWGLAKAGRLDEARAVALEMTGKAFPNGEVDLASVVAALGDADEAFALLERARRARSSRLLGLDRDLRFAELNAHPRFHALLAIVAGPDGGK